MTAPTSHEDDATTYTDLEISSGHPRTRHIFKKDEDTALCGHPSTADHDRSDAPQHVAAVLACGNCRQALTGERVNYRSENDAWNVLDDLRDDDRIRVTLTNGDIVDGVVTSEDDTSRATDLRIVRATSQPEKPRSLRPDEAGVKLSGNEDETISAEFGLISNKERDVESIDIVGTYDWLADDDPQERERVRWALEREAAVAGRAVGGASNEFRANELSFVESRLSNAAYLVRERDWSLSWLAQYTEKRLEHYDVDDAEDDDDRAQIQGSILAYQTIAEILAAVGWDDDSDSDGEKQTTTPARSDGGQLRADGGVPTDTDESGDTDGSGGEGGGEHPDTHFAHVRYAASDAADVRWYDPRDFRMQLRLGDDRAEAAAGEGDLRVTHAKIKPFRPGEFGTPTDRYLTQRQVKVPAPGHPSGRPKTIARHAVHDSVDAAREHLADVIPGFEELPRRDAVAERTGGDEASE